MSEDALKYDRMVEDALRTVVRRALTLVAENGLPGDHNFYITFRTGNSGVEMPDHLREHYPGEMTIVMQHQFWGLDVGEDAFAVTLTFSGAPERLSIPFEAISAFADPSVRFALQFDLGDEDEIDSGDEADSAATETPGENADDEPTKAEKGDAASDKVVTLDTFRNR